jgi:hypothetical protein
MNKSPMMLTNERLLKPKSFWEKNEGTTGMIIIALALTFGGFVLFTFLPFIIMLLSNIITASVLAAIVALIVYIGTSPRTSFVIGYVFKKISRLITYAIIKDDPFEFLRYCRDRIAKQAAILETQVNNLHGQKIALKRVIDGNTSERAKAAAIAKKSPETSVGKVNRRQFMRLSESNEKLAKVYRVMEVLGAALGKYQEACNMLIEDTDNEITVRETEYRALSTGYSAIQAAKKIISGGSDAQEDFDLTIQYLEQDVGQKMGEVEGFLKTSQNFIAGFDLQNDMYDQQALEELERWTKQGDSLLLSDKSDFMLLGPDLTVQGLNESNGTTPNYLELLNKVNN